MSLQWVTVVGSKSDEIDHIVTSMTEDAIITCTPIYELDHSIITLNENLPDLLLICADSLDTPAQPVPQSSIENTEPTIATSSLPIPGLSSVNQFLLSLREQFVEYRPIIVVQTSSENAEQRIEFLVNGADDILPQSLSIDELRIRLLVHLRRNLDILSNRLTRLPGLQLTAKVLQRRMNHAQPWSLISIDLSRFQEYCEAYGPVPGEHVIRSFANLLGSTVIPPDFIGHTDTITFAVVTHPEQAEKIAKYLCEQFEAIAAGFYPEEDRNKGYIISRGDNAVSRRVGFIGLNIGIVSSNTAMYQNYKAAFTAVKEMKALASLQPGSHWVSDRFKLTGGLDAMTKPAQSSILVLESDAALAFLLQATLEMQHYWVETTSNPHEALNLLKERNYQLVLMDSVLAGEPCGWEICQEIKRLYPNIHVIFISTLHDRDAALNAGADLYLPKPFELVALFTWIERTLKTAI